MVQLKAVPANGHTESEPPHVDIVIQPSTLLRAKHRGIDADFFHQIKEVALEALDGFEPGDIVDSTMLCAYIRYGLSKGERLNAGRVILLLAETKEHLGELPLKSLGRNTANLQQYRVK
jgi:hypothetical protein